jgi:hypothetical protein
MSADEPESDGRLSRRRLLRWGSAATAVAVAGCLGEDSDDGNGPGGDGGNQTDGNQTSDDTDNSDDDTDDENNSDDEDNSDDENGESEYTSFDTELETIVQLRGVVTGTGSIVTDEIHEWAVDEDRAGLGMTESGEFSGHTLYEVADEEVNLTMAVNENNLVLGGDRSLTEAALQTVSGERERGQETYAEYRWLLSAVGDGEFVYGGFQPESEHSSNETGPRTSANGYAVSMETDNGETRARFAATYPELTEEIRESVRAEAGGDADEREVAFEGDRAFVRATYGDDLIAALDGAGSDAQVMPGDGSEPATTEGSVPQADTGGLPGLSGYVWLQDESLAVSGATIGIGPFRTIEDGSLDALDSTDPLLVEPVRRGVNLHNNLGRVLLGNFPYLFQIVFDVTPSEGN